MSNKLYPCLWFDGQAKAAAEFYCSVFKTLFKRYFESCQTGLL
jgi:predicted 3-demethylubiquinone-9 3-methyltransferase (glyoxalase superfamily)